MGDRTNKKPRANQEKALSFPDDDEEELSFPYKEPGAQRKEQSGPQHKAAPLEPLGERTAEEAALLKPLSEWTVGEAPHLKPLIEWTAEEATQRKPLGEWTAEEVQKEVLAWAQEQRIGGCSAPRFPVSGCELTGPGNSPLYVLKLFFPGQNVAVEGLLAHLRHKARQTKLIAVVVDQVLREVAWPLVKNVELVHPVYAKGSIHASMSSSGEVVASPDVPSRPDFLLSNLGHVADKNPLLSFGDVASGDKPTVILAPSAAGKTRMLYELLHHKFGLFILFTEPEDKNQGSTALSSITKRIEANAMFYRPESELSRGDWQERRAFVEFGIKCVFLAYYFVFQYFVQDAEKKQSGSVTPKTWLLVQLFPRHFLNSDLFDQLAVELFTKCDRDEVMQYRYGSKEFRDFYVVLDEAQVFSLKLRDRFRSSVKFEQKRSLWSAVLSGFAEATPNRQAIFAGTGLSIMEVWDTAVSGVASADNLPFTKFPTLTAAQVESMLKSTLVTKGQNVAFAAQWLEGRPRFAAAFVVLAIEENKSIDEEIGPFVHMMTRSSVSRSLCSCFQRLKASASTTQQVPNPYLQAVSDAFQISFGRDAEPSSSAGVLEAGVGYLVPSTRETFLEPEALLLETARRLFESDDMCAEHFLSLGKDNPSDLGLRFESIFAGRFLSYLERQRLENYSLFEGFELPDSFKGAWERLSSSAESFGRQAKTVKTAPEFVSAVKAKQATIYMLDDHTGPNVVLQLKNARGEYLTVLLQIKVRIGVDVAKALLTLDPLLLWQQPTPHLPSGPVLRILVSALDEVNGTPQKVPSQRATGQPEDVQILIGPKQVENIIGKRLMTVLKESRS